MLNGYIDTFLDIYTQTQATVSTTSHGIVKYMPETNMSTKVGRYAKYLTCIYMGCPRSLSDTETSNYQMSKNYVLYNILLV